MHTTLVVIKTNVSLYTHHFYNVIVMSESIFLFDGPILDYEFVI